MHDLEFPDGVKVAIDAVIDSKGWKFEIFPRRQADLMNVRDILKEKKITFEENERFHYTTTFDFEAPQEEVSRELLSLITILAN